MSRNSSSRVAAHFRIVGRVREVAREDHEVGLLVEGVDGGHRLLEGAGRIRVDLGIAETPVCVRQLNEMEFAGGRAGQTRPARQGGGEHDAAEARQLEEVPPVNAVIHIQILSRWLQRDCRPRVPVHTGHDRRRARKFQSAS